MGTGSFRG